MITPINFNHDRMHYSGLHHTNKPYPYSHEWFNHPPKFIDNLSYGDLHSDKSGVFVYLPYCTYSDYDDSCAVERANYDYAISNFSHMFDNRILYKVYGGYNTTAIACNIRRLKAVMRFFNDDSYHADKSAKEELYDYCLQFIEETNNLENYPCYDDEMVSQKEDELFNEALDSYLISDCKRTIETHLEDELELEDYAPIEDETIREYIYTYMRENDTYPEIESGGSVYLKIEDELFILGYLAHYDVLTGKKIYIPSEDDNQLKMNI